MKYKNTKTGAIIETSTNVSGDNWKPAKNPRRKKRHLKSRRLTKRKAIPKTMHKRAQNNGSIRYTRRYIYPVA